jgi:hypothetical protein
MRRENVEQEAEYNKNHHEDRGPHVDAGRLHRPWRRCFEPDGNEQEVRKEHDKRESGSGPHTCSRILNGLTPTDDHAESANDGGHDSWWRSGTPGVLDAVVRLRHISPSSGN